MLEQCAVQIDEMRGAAERRVPEADDPAAGRRCRATQQIDYLHKQCSALHVKDHRIINHLNLSRRERFKNIAPMICVSAPIFPLSEKAKNRNGCSNDDTNNAADLQRLGELFIVDDLFLACIDLFLR